MINLKARFMVGAATVALAAGGLGVMGATTASAAPARPAATITCLGCFHVQNTYAFRGALAANHQGTAIDTPMILWYETAAATDPGADLFPSTVTNAITGGHVNQSHLFWGAFNGDSVVRFKYTPFGNGTSNVYVGLQGDLGNPTGMALRHDNPNSVWQEWIEAPADAAGRLLPAAPGACTAGKHCVLINVGQTQNTNDPMVATDPGNAFTGSGVQQDVEPENINQFGAITTAQVWRFQN